MVTQGKARWTMKGDVISACNCDWGCPCNFDAPPTKGFCEGLYVFHINQGAYNKVKLDGLHIAYALHAPQAIHLGNMTVYIVLDEKASAEQREALGAILGGKLGGPFAIFAPLITKVIGPDFAPVEWKFAGPNSYVRMGDKINVALASIKNPVTGKVAGFTIKFTDGLLTDESHPMTTSAYRVNHKELSFSHPGKYGQTFNFNYSGQG